MTESQRLADQLTRYFVQKTPVFLSFADATDGLTAAQAIHVPQEKFNSVWRVVNHVCYWVEASALVIQGSDKQPETLGADTGGWYSIETPDDTAWQLLRARTITLNTQLADVIGALNDEQLHTTISKWKQTPYEIGQSILAHNSYHTCEIISLRHMQGSWVKA